MAAMKWWGWGDENVSFTHEDKPALGPFLRAHLDLDVDARDLAAGRLREACTSRSRRCRPTCRPPSRRRWATHVSTDPLDRVVHARGKSLRDLVRHRRGDLGRLPDVVVRPAGEDEVATVLRAALDADAVLIPFGGGTEHLRQPRGPAARSSAR